MGNRGPIVVILSAATLLLASCGHAGVTKDPFVGTWQSSAPRMRLVIAKVGESYRTIVVDSQGPGWVGPYKRTGNELKAILHVPIDGITDQVIVDYHPATGQLTDKDGSGPAPAWDFSRVSDSTAAPSPSPSASLIRSYVQDDNTDSAARASRTSTSLAASDAP